MDSGWQWISFTTDYGLGDPFVGVCHGVMARIAPHARVLDLTHGVLRGDVANGALLLADCLPDLPAGVHLAVVDPGVGTDRRAIAVATADGQVLVGPDNGLLIPAAERLGGISGAWELTASEYHRQPVSRTFHGRDIFSPVAAHVAAGTPPEALGPSLEPAALVQLKTPGPLTAAGQVAGEVVVVDSFGNVALSLQGTDLHAAGLHTGDRVAVRFDDVHAEATVATAFGDVDESALVVLVDSFGRVALAINRGDAARRLGLRSGTQVTVSRRPG